MNILDNFMERYVPAYQWAVLQYIHDANKSEFRILEKKLLKVRETIQQMPTYWDIAELEAKDIKVGLHYFIYGNCDWFIGTTNTSNYSEPSFGFARLNNDYYNAELGSIWLQELVNSNSVELDLNWNGNKTMQQVMDENRRLLRKAAA